MNEKIQEYKERLKQQIDRIENQEIVKIIAMEEALQLQVILSAISEKIR